MRYLIGIGNYYGLDDSIGLRIAETIGDRGLDGDFQAVDMGGNLLDLVHYLGEPSDEVLIVDAARMGMRPGEWRLFTPTDVDTRKVTGGMSTHEGDLMKVLEFASSLGHPLARITILGIEPARVADEPGLSPELEARFEEYLRAAVGFFSDSGAVGG